MKGDWFKGEYNRPEKVGGVGGQHKQKNKVKQKVLRKQAGFGQFRKGTILGGGWRETIPGGRNWAWPGPSLPSFLPPCMTRPWAGRGFELDP